MEEVRYCPICHPQVFARIIETTEPDGTDEYKEVCTCDQCECLFYIIRKIEE